MQQGHAKVVVILVNYNGATYLEDCIRSIVGQSYRNHEIVMVDNQSVDGSAQAIVCSYPNVKVIYADENGGWGQGSNIGAEYAFSHGAEYALLLNTDTEIESDMLEQLIRYADERTVTSPTMYAGSKGDSREIWYAGGMIDYSDVTVKQDVFKNMCLDGSKETVEVNFISGCCMLIHRNIWRRIGGFDSSYFMYYEDVDYCIKMRSEGIRMLYIPSAYLYHKVGGSSGSAVSYLSEYYQVRNRLLLAERYRHIIQRDEIEILHCILRERNYFQTFYYKKYKNFAIAGIKDFLRGIVGKENNLFNRNFVIKSGFYDREQNETDQWYWGSEPISEIEIQNPFNKEQVMSIITAQYLPGESNRTVTIYADDKEVFKLRLPEVLHYECIMKPKSKLTIRWETDEPVPIDGDLRGLTFQMANPEVTFRDLK